MEEGRKLKLAAARQLALGGGSGRTVPRRSWHGFFIGNSVPDAKLRYTVRHTVSLRNLAARHLPMHQAARKPSKYLLQRIVPHQLNRFYCQHEIAQ